MTGVWLQNLDMRYNIRSQLLSINNSTLTNDMTTVKSNGDTNDVFGMNMLYDQTDSNIGNTARYNGRLTAVKWMSRDGSGTATRERSYKFTYDDLGRYTDENYGERTTAGTGSFSSNAAGFDEYGISYDDGGNIIHLYRNSSTVGGSSYTTIDNLTYTYDDTNNPDRLYSVSDASSNSSGFVGGTGNYVYDTGGNLTADPYKGLGLTYNDLGKTNVITVTAGTGQHVDYTYDGGGNVIRKQVYNSGSTTVLTDYVDGFVYDNSTGSETLAYFPMPEGRVLYNAGSFNQEFIITDQQGNARVSFRNNSGTVKVYQENSYYGYGMALTSAAGIPATPNKNLYNGGSEWQNDYSSLPDYYQTFYRNYDAALGRFVGVDPMAEETESISTYQYGNNNPIMFNDPLGDDAYNNQLRQNGAGVADAFVDPGDLHQGFTPNYSGDGGSWAFFNDVEREANAMNDNSDVGGNVIYYAGDGTSGNPATGFSKSQLRSYFASVDAGHGLGSFTATDDGIAYEYQTGGPGIYAANGIGDGGGIILHSGYIDANQGGIHNISQAGIDFIKNWETYSPTAYDASGRDHRGDWTIGWGHKILAGESFPNGITPAGANALLLSDIRNKAIDPINRLVTASLNQQQFDALVDYVFATGSLGGTNLLRDLNNGDFPGALSQMNIITQAHRVMRGMITRRQQEHNIWLYGNYNSAH